MSLLLWLLLSLMSVERRGPPLRSWWWTPGAEALRAAEPASVSAQELALVRRPVQALALALARRPAQGLALEPVLERERVAAAASVGTRAA